MSLIADEITGQPPPTSPSSLLSTGLPRYTLSGRGVTRQEPEPEDTGWEPENSDVREGQKAAGSDSMKGGSVGEFRSGRHVPEVGEEESFGWREP